MKTQCPRPLDEGDAEREILVSTLLNSMSHLEALTSQLVRSGLLDISK